ncbi:hypothetical protein [Streptomyces sp. VRA16 Mangrove soil]|uniref:hypothetical protein n=1 Tax=Streptomyces sp. VRA16 Mangrove soil TaxID=2817434 RepID=UPI001A9D1D12|nr:hypothetical protein [Streptomyces sp. VRA16 Mangrove soil]MBO1334832.1 hypothetical protein [Streptomyces sp. VRA16 Mangrove soil]
MLRHAISPTGSFSQVPNHLIRHPRLSADALRLLLWQLSLPADARDSLSRTAEKAGLGKCAFLRAKRQLKAEGLVHEWRMQGERGRWETVQLVSGVPLSAEEAIAVRDGGPRAEPAGAAPAAGEPTRPEVGRHPGEDPGGNTSNPPAPPEPGGGDDEAAQFVAGISELDSRLRIPRAMVAELVGRVREWFAHGHTAHSLWQCIRRQLPGRTGWIERPGGLLRYVLAEIQPAPPVVRAAPEARAASVSRVARMRECEGERHVQATLFLPVGDEELCGRCRA